MSVLRRGVLRLASLLLLGAAGARGAAPVADGLLHHRGALREAAGPHLDQPGGCGAHAEHCVLRAPTSGLRFTFARPAALAACRQVARNVERQPGSDPRRPVSFSRFSRAPPVTA